MYTLTSTGTTSTTISLSSRRRAVRFSCSVAHKERLKKSQSVTREKVGDGDDNRLSGGIHVPREEYISVPKAELLDGLMSLFESEDDADAFARFSRCLDSVLHAEHKVLLEELRLYYSLTSLQEEKGKCGQETITTRQWLPLNGSSWKIGINGQVMGQDDGRLSYNHWHMKSRFGEYARTANTMSSTVSRVDLAANFQHAFMKLLRDAKFVEISANDLLLTRALKTDYLLTLPIYVDWKRALDSNAIIFRRGYATERQTGLLIVEKLDYLQSKLLQRTFFLLSKPSKKIGIWISEALKHSNKNEKIYAWMERAKVWLVEQSIPQKMRSYIEGRSDSPVEDAQSTDRALPIWLAARRAVPLYEGLLSPVGPRGRLMRKLLTWTGLIPSSPEIPFEVNKENKYSEAYLRPNFLPRITLSDIWRPATREYCRNNLWETLQTGVTVLFTKSLLQEPAFQQLILLYTDDTSQKESGTKTEVLPLRLKIYERIPIPDLPVIFPHRKLSFRILDTIRLDVASILGLLAYFVNYKFETIISSPSAFLLDVVAIGALIIYGSRVVLGYKQTWDRYQLLVNRTLYEKTLASGFGSIHFLLDASEQQQHKEAILAYALLLYSEKDQTSSRKSIKDACERFMYDKFSQKIEMPIDSAIETLLRLKIVSEVSFQETLKLEALPCFKACDALKHQWDKLLQQKA